MAVQFNPQQLNPQQLAAVRYIDGPVLVLAGAGSGKTRVITQKIAYLIHDCGMPARNIAALTFTNKAAREMRERAGKLIRSQDAKGLRVSTFHTLGLDIIRREYKALGFKARFSIYDARDSLQLLQELNRDGDAALIQSVQWQISRWKSARVLPEQALSEATDEVQQRAAPVYADYNRQLQAYNAVDFDDLILLPLLLFKRQPEILEAWRKRIRYLLIDEYQDTNACQYHLVKALVGIRGALTVVGDDDQSIYAWRGAQPENLRLLAEDFPRLKLIKLEQNYRSVRRILKIANQLISLNSHVFEKKLWSELGHGEAVRVIVCKHAEHEAERVAAELLTHKFKHSTRYSDYAILYRSNHQARILEQRLRDHRIPYRISGGNSFFDYTEVKDLLAYLRLLSNPDDDAAFLRIANIPRRELGPTTLEKLALYARQRGVSLLAASTELGLGQVLSERALQKLQSFAHWLQRLSAWADSDPVALLQDLIETCRYREWLKSESSDPRQAERKLNNIDELVEWVTRLAEQDNLSLNEIVARMTLIDRLDREDNAAEQEAVALMTLHTAKGLEFPHVFMVGLEEDLLPHRNSVMDGQLEEERRLAYVGITRAQRSLVLTLAKRRKRYGEWEQCDPSRFLEELPAEDLAWEGVDNPLAPEERQARGRSQLDVLKGMLAGKG